MQHQLLPIQGIYTPRGRGGADSNLQQVVGKISIPILAIAAFNCELIDPLDLIITFETATKDFNDASMSKSTFFARNAASAMTARSQRMLQ
jgi:hypothetical protein